MRRRILFAILSIAVLAITLFGVPLALLVERFIDDDAMLRVEREAILAARVVPEDLAASGHDVQLPTNGVGIELGLYDLDGSLLAGSGPLMADAPTAAALRNHVMDRETDRSRVVAVPVSADQAIIGAIRAEQSTAGSDARTVRILLFVGSLAVGVIAVGAGIGYIVAERLARPVRKLRDAAVQLGDSDFALEVHRSNIPEIDQASVALSATASRLDALVARERSFSSDASHQLRTPLAGLRALIETELAFPRSDPARVLNESLEDVDRLERTIDELLSIARSTTSDQPAVAALTSVLDEVAIAWRGRFAAVGRLLDVANGDGVYVRGNPLVLRHALDVLVDNALVHGGGTARLRVERGLDSITITVSDEGEGFAFAPTSASSDTLNGLGLPLADRLVAALPGRLELRVTTQHPQIAIVLQRAASSDR